MTSHFRQLLSVRHYTTWKFDTLLRIDMQSAQSSTRNTTGSYTYEYINEKKSSNLANVVYRTGVKITGDEWQRWVVCVCARLDFNSASLDPLDSRSPPYSASNLGTDYRLQNPRFNTSEWLQIDTDLLLIITSTADELSGGTKIDYLELHWTPKIWIFSEFFCDFRLRHILKEWIFAEIIEDRLRQPAYEIKLMLSCVLWALAQISWLLYE